jgi:hypothetical protein
VCVRAHVQGGVRVCVHMGGGLTTNRGRQAIVNLRHNTELLWIPAGAVQHVAVVVPVDHVVACIGREEGRGKER